MFDSSDEDCEKELTDDVISFMLSVPDSLKKDPRKLSEYKITKRLARGSFGDVFKATHQNVTVALKKVPMKPYNRSRHEKIIAEGKREIRALSTIPRHRNIIQLHEVIASSDAIYLSLEYCRQQLYSKISERGRFTEAVAKSLINQLLQGLSHIHETKIIHRDIKPENLLIKDGVLKIADFGSVQIGDSFSPQAVTLWYRPPEILLGATSYTTSVDIWSSGCVLSEMLSSKVLFKGDSQISQINSIVDCLGTPKDWPELEDLPVMQCMSLNERKSKFNETMDKFCGEPSKEFLRKLLVCNPSGRLSAIKCLKDKYFDEKTEPCLLSSSEIARWLEKPHLKEEENVRKRLRRNFSEDF